MIDTFTRRRALILGGAGFLGSHISHRFSAAGYGVTIIDGLLNQTGGRREHVSSLAQTVEFIEAKIEDVRTLEELVAESDVIVDCMAWTAHRSAITNPVYDLRINGESHLHLLRHVHARKRIIYLGSRSQYGNPSVAEITEDTPMVPVDIHGIHKLAAESYYRVYAVLKDFNVTSLRFPNCFGENQLITGEDIGLVGGFIHCILNGEPVEIFGRGRKRALAYAPDVAEVVYRLNEASLNGFSAFNYSGYDVDVESLVKELIQLAGQGTYRLENWPPLIRDIDIGNAKFSSRKLGEFLGHLPITDFRTALSATIAYFKENMS